MQKVKNRIVERIYPLTPMQEGMLFHKMLDEQSASYVVQEVMSVKANLQEAMIIQSLQLLSQRHEILRTAIVYKNVKTPQQVLFYKRKIELEAIDLSDMDEDQRDLRIKEIKEEDVARGFELEKDNLLRMKIIHCSHEQYKIIWSFHHIIMDGWCLSILSADFMSYYMDLVEGKSFQKLSEEVTLEKGISTNYEQYIKWLKSQNHEEGMDYWKTLLDNYEGGAGITPVGPVTQNRKSVDTSRVSLSKQLSDTMRILSAKYNVTVNTLFEIAWSIVLQRYNQTRDVVFGKVVSGRNAQLKGIEKVVGLFINTIVVRITSGIDDSFDSLVHRIHEQALESSKYDYCPLWEVQRLSGVGVESLKTLMVFENYDTGNDSDQFEDILSVESEGFREQTSFPINLVISVQDVFSLGIMYEPSLYNSVEIELLLSRLVRVVEQITNKPLQKLDDIMIISDGEKEQIMGEFNDTKTQYPRNETIQNLFEEQVLKSPYAEAVVCANETLTYEQLNARADSLQGELLRRGVQAGQLVGIMTEKSVHMIAGIIAILKCGCGYVPLNGTDPQSRLEFMLQDCDIQSILCGEDNHIVAASLKGCEEVVDLCGDYEPYTVNYQGEPNDVAYVIFTSGTTGQPKGVIVEHRNVIRLVRNTNYVNFEEPRILQTGSLSFDASTFEIWGSLLNGGMLCLAEIETLTDGIKLKKVITNHHINTMFLTTQLFNNIMDDCPHAFNGLRDLLVGGERHTERHVNALIRQRKGVRFVNIYGPTENTTFSIMLEIDKEYATLPIGKPISNSTAFILSQGGQLCGIGMLGELYVGGDGVARGYLNLPEMTSQKFVPNPYAPGEKMYCTGDLARWLPDGNIEFLGRIDQQVKIRGYRIELGEIESTLRKQAGIKDAVVIAKEEPSGDKYICAYIILNEDNSGFNHVEFKNGLRRLLPEYMIPTYIMDLKQLPITANGKLDRRALPKLEMVGATVHVAPRNETEETLVIVFKEVLGLSNVSVDDNFFEIGGHSLRAIRVVNMIESRTGTRLPLKAIFEYPTAEALANVLQTSQKEVYQPIPVAENKDAYPMSSAQKRLYIINQMDNQGTAYNMPSMIEMDGIPDLIRIREVFAKLVNRHESLRTSFHIIDGEMVQVIEKHVEALVECDELEEGGSRNFKDELMHQFVHNFSLNKAPLIRLKVVITGEGQGLLLFDMHHMISDGATIQIITREFSHLYNGENLLPLKIQYKDYSEWMSKKDLTEQKDYWLSQFEGEIPVLDLPLDYPRPPMQSFIGATYNKRMNKTTRDSVLELCRQTGTTEYMVLLSGFMILLSKYSRQQDIIVGSPISGRNHQDIENMVGMFVNTLAMRGRPQGNKDYISFLAEIRDTCIKGFENQEYPFENLVELVQFKRDLSRNPLFDVMFVLQNNENEDFTPQGLVFGDVKVSSQSAKFDLTLTVNITAEGYMIHWEYCNELFNDDTIRRYANHFNEIIREITIHSRQKISEIEFLCESEKNQILIDFNDNFIDYSRNKTIIELFGDQVNILRDETAVICNSEQISYGELDQKSNAIANALITYGIKPGNVVALSLPRSIELVSTILAILKIGAAFLPIEPEYPEERVQFILDDSLAEIIITGEVTYTLNNQNCKQISIDVLMNSNNFTSPNVVTDNDSLSYCIYTSGSTGKPKGVKILNGNLLNYLMYCKKEYVKAIPAMPLFTSICFDLTLTSLFVPLCFGGKLYIYNNGIDRDLFDIFSNQELTIIKLTPSHLKLANGYSKAQHLPQLECLIVGGEELESRTSEEALETFGMHVDIHNEYGPTETTIGCFDYIYKCGSNRRAVLIGKPISNTQALIMNESNKLCGIGMPGELCIGGDGVSEGYMNRPQLTEEKFIENPYAEGERIYKTGDLAKWLPDGNIDYLGRMDEQVKIRGFRIELGEIEDVIKRQEDISDAAVVVRADLVGDQFIFAYVVNKNTESKLDIEKIKSNIRKLLPVYMIPSGIMEVGELLVNQNGKLDKKNLPDFEWNGPNDYVAPSTSTESELASLFEKTLGITKVGVNDNFFDRGGNSIKAIKIITKLREQGYTLSILHVFNHPTVFSLAALLTSNTLSVQEADYSNGQDGEEADFVRTEQDHTNEMLELVQDTVDKMNDYAKILIAQPIVKVQPLSSIQKVSYAMGIRSSYAKIRLKRKLNIRKFEEAVLYMLQTHPVLRSTITINDDVQEMIEFKCPDEIHMPFIDITSMNKRFKKITLESIRNLYKIFDGEDRYSGGRLSNGLVIIKQGERDYTFLMPCTHLIFDGMSNQSFCNQLMELYDQKKPLKDKEIIVYDYKEYVDQIGKGPVDTTEEEMIRRLSLHEFGLAVKEYQNLTKDLKFKAVPFTFDLDEIRISELQERMWQISGAIYVGVIKFLFPDANIPVLLVHTGRKYLNKDYYTYIGEFIDFLPYVIRTSSDTTFRGEVEDNIQFLSNHNINMASMFEGTALQQKYPGVASAFSGITLSHMNIPTYNYLAIFNSVQDVEISNDAVIPNGAEDEHLAMYEFTSTSVALVGNKLHIGAWSLQGKEESLKEYLNELVNGLLKL